jgi:hypothetical protein
VEETASRYRGYLRIYQISSHGQPTKGGPLSLGLDKGLTTPHHEKLVWYKMLNRASELVDFLE